MNDIFKVNQNRHKTAMEISEVLNNRSMLLNLEVEDRVSNVQLHVVTDSVHLEYSECKKEGMEKFLATLREHVINKNEVDELLEDIQYVN
ncbi:hypothetical protein DALLNEIH_03771 [Bacillus sp. B01(2024)]